MKMAEVLEAFMRQPAERKFYARVPDDHVLDGGSPGRKFIAEQSYFELRLAEMFLRDRRQYWRGFVPLAVTVSKFLYAGKRQTVPFLIGNQLLKQIETYIQDECVEYRNTRIAGPAPYAGDDVSLFTGLFRSQVTNLSEQLWHLVEDLVTAFDVTQLSRYLDIARPIQTGLAQLLGMKEVEYQTGARQVFTGNAAPETSACFREGYLAYVNCPEASIQSNSLWVKDGRLYVGTTPKQMERLQKHDYGLVEISLLTQRDDYSAFAFHQVWEKAQKEIYEGDPVKARKLFLDLSGHVATCADFTQTQRYDLIRLYKANFERDVAVANDLRGMGDSEPKPSTRGGTNRMDARSAVGWTAMLAHNARASEIAVDGLLELQTHWDRIPGLEPSAELRSVTNDLLKAQLEALGRISHEPGRDPLALADALTIATLSGSQDRIR
jgi:hypothetical protein